GDPETVGIAGAAAPALREEDRRQLPLRGDLEHAVLLAMVLHALCAGEHRVVVGHHHTLRPRRLEELAVYVADARNQALGRRALDQVLHGAPTALRGDHERTVLDERSGVTEILDVLSCGSLTGLPPARDCIRPSRV